MDTYSSLCRDTVCSKELQREQFQIPNRSSTYNYLKQNQTTMKIDRCRERNSLHSLMIQRVSTCFTNNQIGPLNNDNRYEKSGVTRIFENFTLLISLNEINDEDRCILVRNVLLFHPFLPVRIFQIVECLRFPRFTQTE